MLMKFYLLALAVFLAIDMVWLGLVAKNFYAKEIGFLMKTEVNWLAAGLFYLIFIAGLVFLVILPAWEKGSWGQALWTGALFGLVAYATYDLTNLATLKDWPLAVTVADLIWGTVLSATVSGVTYLLALKIGL